VHLHTGRATWLRALARLALPALNTRRMDRRVRPSFTTRALYGRLLRRVAAISPAVLARLRAGGVREDALILIRSSVDPGAFATHEPREGLRADLGVDADTALILTLANLVPRKGVDVLLAAVAALGPGLAWRLVVAGDGPERARLESRARELGVETRTSFLGRREDKVELLQACDLFVLSARAEGMGVAALEAMAAARPVIGTRVGGLGELVLDGVTGLLVPPEDARALSVALTRLIGDPELCEKLSRAGRARLREGFLAEQMVDAYERLYCELITEDSAR
jgi:glycosyltransferase involved in cell wall biosynthesis